MKPGTKAIIWIATIILGQITAGVALGISVYALVR